ncbi:MAG: hypothetical protein ICCCNLDF_01946 [Planctomycetes bacterium]|nr:hypothetical protein [Planctomycetota bacterium]HRJ77897.1 hypothetical protein [Planctomycetota bacterium]
MDLNTFITLLGVAGGLGGFTFGLYTYYRAQRLRSAEFAANEVSRWLDTRETRQVISMLEWLERDVALETAEGSGHFENLMVHNDELGLALAPHHEKSFSAKETAIRGVFDRFLFGLQRIEHFIASGVVRQRDIEPFLRYYIDLIGRRPSVRMPETSQRALWLYIDFYQMTDVQKLFARFGYRIKP